MCNLSQYTLAQLQAMTKEQLIQQALSGVTTEVIAAREFNSDGEMTLLSTDIYDAYTGGLIKTTEISKTFYPNKAIDKIKVDCKDGDGKKLEKYHIKHSSDGKTKPYRVEENGV